MIHIILSAILFAFPFFYPQFCFLLFFSLVPLLKGSVDKKYGFKQGLLWGFLVFAAQLYWCLQMLFGYKCNLMTILLWLFVVFFYALFAGFWFWLQSYLYQKIFEQKKSADISFIGSWLVSCTLFIYFMIYGSLFFGGVIEGYPFFNPFFICAQYPGLIWCLRYTGCGGALLCFVAFQIFATLGFFGKNKKYLLTSLLCLMPFLLGLVLHTAQKNISIPQSYFIKPWWFLSKEPMFSGYRMVSEVARVARTYETVRFICMPESSFNWNIHDYYQFIEMMGQDAPGVYIGFGGHRRESSRREPSPREFSLQNDDSWRENSLLKSSFFIVKDGQKVFEYDKRHLIPMMERSCGLLALIGLKQLLTQSEFFAYGQADQNDIVNINDVEYQVFICSEFFFEAKKTKGVPVLFVCNDAWLCCNYAKEWVELFVRYFSIRYGVPVFFGSVCGKNNIMTS